MKNLIDPQKGGLSGEAGLKYRTLKMENPKLKARLFCSANDTYVKDLLTDETLVGMKVIVQQAEENNNNDKIIVMEDPPSRSIQDIIGLRVLPAINTTQAKIAQKLDDNATAASTADNNKTNKKAKLLTATDRNNNNNAQPRPPPPSMEKFSEKQKARRMMEEKLRIEKEKEKLYRKQTRAKIAADKLVRETDENWKPSVSAAADKTGTGLQSFRDRHGE